MNFKDTIYFMLFAVHHPPYNIMILFIELSEDGECFAVGLGLFLPFATLFRFFHDHYAASALFWCI
jgi:hypothetical protein